MPKLVAKEHCAGCTACVSICPKSCITMSADNDGFLYPTIDIKNCLSCGLCERSCPIIGPLMIKNSEPKVYAAYSQNESVRISSSSGGIFTQIAEVILHHGGVVYGAAYNEKYEVVHICVEDEETLQQLRGAKYAQSDLQGIFKQIKRNLDAGKMVLFSGTPCQVGGLKAFLHIDYGNLLTVDFVCHSVPSPMAWRKYVEYRVAKDNNGKYPISIDLRSKKTGWSRYQYSNFFEYGDGISHIKRSNESLYMKLFVDGYINRKSCEHCHFKGYSRVSDITLGDFWGIWDIHPEMDDNKGTSVMLVQSKRGEEVLKNIADKLVLKPVLLEEASRENKAMLVSSPSNVKRELAFQLIRDGRIAECEKWFIPKKPTLVQRIQGKIRRVIKRIINKGR